MTTWGAVIAVVCFISVTSGQVVLQNYADPPIAKPGENATFYCVVDQDILNPSNAFCIWKGPGGITITPGAYPNDDFEFIEYQADTMDSKRRCDFVLKSTKPEYHGDWQCQANLQTGPITQAGLKPFKFVVGAIPDPRHPVIIVNGAESSEVNVEAENTLTVSCNLFKTRPKPQFMWYLVSPNGQSMQHMSDVKPVEHEAFEPGTDDLKNYNSTITVQVRADENGMKIRCVANHSMLEESQNSTDLALNVQGQATLKQCVSIGSGLTQNIVDGYFCEQGAYYLSGKDATIEVIFAANPEPRRLEWVVPKFPKNPLSSGEEREGFKAMHWEKYQTFSEDPSWMDQFDRRDLFSAKLQVSDLGEDDIGRYELRIMNGVVDQRTGDEAAKFRFDVRIGERPAAGASTIVIIVVVVVLLLVAAVVGVTIFAWRNSRLCFKADGNGGSGKKRVDKAAVAGNRGPYGSAEMDANAHQLEEGKAQQQGLDAEYVAGSQPASDISRPKADDGAAKKEGDAENAEAVNATNGQKEALETKTTTNGTTTTTTTTTATSAAAGIKTRLSKFLPLPGAKKSKDKDGNKHEKVPLDVKKQTDVEAGVDGAKADGEQPEKKKDHSSLIYADLDLIKNTADGPGEKNIIISSEKTEYAEIIRPVPGGDTPTK